MLGRPAGHERQARPELYVKNWTAQHDLVLVGDFFSHVAY